MAQATEQQARELETALIEQFILIVQGLAFRLGLEQKYGKGAKEVAAYNKIIFPYVNRWIVREGKYESELLKKGYRGGLLASGKLKYDDFFNYDKYPKLYALANEYKKVTQVNGIGEPITISLIVWAVVAIVAAFSAAVIVDDLTTTTEEKEDLMKQTQQTCKDLGLSTEECAKLISQTQQEASAGSGMGDMLKIGLLALLGFGIYKVAIDKN